jgi:DNA-binding transcriptional regulator YiaG
MNDIELLNKAIELYSDGNQARFSTFTHIKESTLKTWRSRGVVPDDKILLLNTLIENHKLIQENNEYKEYFKLQNEFMKKFQN